MPDSADGLVKKEDNLACPGLDLLGASRSEVLTSFLFFTAEAFVEGC